MTLAVSSPLTDSTALRHIRDLNDWRCAARPAGTITHPDQLAGFADAIPAAVPGTVAAALAANGGFSWDSSADLDRDDWWFETRFAASESDGPIRLVCEGLATHAEVWLNGQLILTTGNMFCRDAVDLRPWIQPENHLVIGFRSLSSQLAARRPRPRWKTNLVSHQQLRWHRTSLYGRIPGWTPPAPPIGPWRAVRVEQGAYQLDPVSIQTQVDGSTGVVTFQATAICTDDIRNATLWIEGYPSTLAITQDGQQFTLAGQAIVPDVQRWWPHTHGQAHLYPAALVVATARGTERVDLGRIGFRELGVEPEDGFRLLLNGQPVWCRGACWTLGDNLNLVASPERLRHDLTLARDAGVNMLRVTGTLAYESDEFYRLCDELGMLVWQDFQFACMDYPFDDIEFRASVTREVRQQVQRLAAHPCVAVYCGSSEVEQQAAMRGIASDQRVHAWFDQDLPSMCAAGHPGTAYQRSTPTGGVLPFQPNMGLTHYYGVGAYLRDVTDVRRSDVRFTPECLGFSNVPDAATVEAILPGMHPVMHHPRWKARVPRDTGAGWDFEDVRDHYLKAWFEVDPVALRSRDVARYLALSRLVTGEMMAQTFSEWRSVHSHNDGALVWFYKDLWPAAGWGIVDSSGRPKAAYYFLKRVWQPRQVVITDEGLNGLHVHLINETSADAGGSLEIALLKEPQVRVAGQSLPVSVSGRSRQMFSADEVLGGFYDVSYAYRFGPPHHDLVAATWYDAQHRIISQAMHHIRRGVPVLRAASLELRAEADGDQVRVHVRSNVFLHAVEWNAPGFLPDDNYFALMPDTDRTVNFRRVESQPSTFKATVAALNLESTHTVKLTP